MKNANMISFYTLVRKEIIRFTRIWPQTILPSAITTILYFVIFGRLIGSRIGELEGINYVLYITPGLVMMAVINNSYSNVSSSFFSQKFVRSIDEMLIAPMPNYIILIGYLTGGVLRSIIVGIIVIFIALFFTKLSMHYIGITLLVILISATLFSLAGFINAVYANKFDSISIIPTFLLTPLTYLGGVFYSVKMLPPFWQMVSRANPILYMVNAFRYGMLGISDIRVGFALSIMILFTIALFAFSLRLLQKGVGLRT